MYASPTLKAREIAGEKFDNFKAIKSLANAGTALYTPPFDESSGQS